LGASKWGKPWGLLDSLLLTHGDLEETCRCVECTCFPQLQRESHQQAGGAKIELWVCCVCQFRALDEFYGVRV
jgi:hypothetical protein